MRSRWSITVLFVLLGAFGAAMGQDAIVPLRKRASETPEKMMRTYWLRQAEQAFDHWRAEYEGRKTPEQITAYQKALKDKFLEAIGRLPERTPLNPQITGTVARDGYRVEKVVFESQPRHYVTGLLFLPEASRFKPPYPGVLIPCGHSRNGKGSVAYQSMGALLALSGMAALVFDPIDQGERGQYLGEQGWPALWGTRAHTMSGVGSILLGRNTARFEIWDGMRAIDYLQSRPEIDPKRIGCTGNSGGGTQTSYLMALDDRIAAAAPSCYLCGFSALLRTIGPQDAEQNIFGQLAFGMDHADYLMMRAPRPVLMCVATKDFFDIRGAWDAFRCGKRLYTRLDFAERIDLLENDEGHNYNTRQREGVARWMSRWLLGQDQPIREPEIRPLSAEECQCTSSGQVMLLPGARSVYDLNEAYEEELATRRRQMWASGNRAELLAEVGRIAGIRRLEQLPKPHVEVIEEVEHGDQLREQLVFEPETGITLPATIFRPKTPIKPRAVLYLREPAEAADAGPIQRLIEEGKIVFAVDLPGAGQGQSKAEVNDAFRPYLLGRSYIGLWAEQILSCARYAQERFQPEHGVQLVAAGPESIAALHAAALEPALFVTVKLVHSLHSWSSVILARLTWCTPIHVVHGALRTYDLPDLAATLGEKLSVEQPQDGSQAPAVDLRPTKSSNPKKR